MAKSHHENNGTLAFALLVGIGALIGTLVYWLQQISIALRVLAGL